MPQLPGRHRITLTRREAIFSALGAVGLIMLLVAAFVLGRVTVPPTADAAPLPAPTPAAQELPAPIVPAPVLSIDPSQAPAPGMDAQFAPPDGPAIDSPPFDVDAVAMREELRGHGVDLPDSRLGELVTMANKYIAEDIPDLMAWDPRITADVKKMFPEADRETRVSVVRCTAEYIERVIARNHGWAHPPDEDDHGVPVGGVPGGTPSGGTNPRPR